ncbi:MAG: tetratricopeptide repeat protein [Cyanobacteria bacterium P01_F01_bin.153]
MAKDSSKRSSKRWWMSGVLILALLAFLGLSALPLIGSFMGPGGGYGGQQAQTPGAGNDQARLQSEVEAFEIVLQREPENETALRGLLEARLRLGDVAGAIAPLEKLSELNPEEAQYGILLAQAKQQQGDREGAATIYRKILEESPLELQALQGLSVLLVSQERPQAAIGLIQDAIDTANGRNEEQPGSVEMLSLRMLLGQIYAQLRRFDDAIATYDKAVELDPQNFRPILAKAIVLKADGKEDQAQQLFATATSLAPDQFKDSIQRLATADPGDNSGLAIPETAPGGVPGSETRTPPSPAPAESAEP